MNRLFPYRISRRLLAVVLLPLLLTATAQAARATETDKAVTKAYTLALARCHSLDYSPGLAKDRQNWLPCLKALDRAYQLNPQHGSAPNILFSQAELYSQMYKNFGAQDDLDRATATYDAVSLQFPNHSLADDALFRRASLLAEEGKDGAAAASVLNKLLTAYPNGDMREAATNLLQRIKASAAPTATAAQGTGPRPEAVASPPPAGQDSAPQGGAEVLSVRHWSTQSYTRVVIETTAPITFSGHLLKTSADSPSKRIYVDLKNCLLTKRLQEQIPVKDGLLHQIRSAQFDRETVRVVMDAQSIADYKISSLSDPFRVIVDVKGCADAKLPPLPEATAQAKTPPPAQSQAQSQSQLPPAPAAQAPPHPAATPPAPLSTASLSSAPAPSAASSATASPAAAAPPQKPPSLAQQLGLSIRRLVIDPGHGGKDPGAIGVGGLKEKDVVLMVAKKVASKIASKMAIEVVLTRSSDVFIPLEERTAIANSKGGDLFISIHANSARSPKPRGIETYYLDLAKTDAEQGIAALENASSAHQISDLQNILNSLMQNTKKDESARLAGIVQDKMITELRRAYPEITSHGVKKAPFVVLIGAQMPSILTEIAFVSNPTEAHRLRDERYTQALADSIADGVVNYATSLTIAGATPVSHPGLLASFPPAPPKKATPR